MYVHVYTYVSAYARACVYKILKSEFRSVQLELHRKMLSRFTGRRRRRSMTRVNGQNWFGRKGF